MSVILKAGVAVLALSVPASASVLTNTFTSYYAFGDSLTDDGKLGQLFPPSLDGRFSNGPTYAEILADEFTDAGLDTGNFALGGATANDVNLEPLSTLSTFAGQIATFGGALGAGAVAPGSNPLVSVFFGANDFFQGRNPIEAAGDVAQGIRDIAALGEGFDDFLLLGLPDIGSTPAFAGEGSEAASAATMIFNAKLARYVRSFEVNDGLTITNFDTDAVFQSVIDSVEGGTFEFGILDVTTPCTVSLSEPGPSCLDLGIDPNTLLFADAVHPNAIAHELLADAIIARYEADLNVVPLPATLPLMLVGMFGMGVLARRKAA
jgi:phospholipase/lecithinase/hemolysin